MTAVTDVTVGFGGPAVISDVSLSLSPGEKVGLVGPNGVGKSTLLKVLAGIIEPTRGTVQHREGETVSYVPQDYSAINDELVADNLKRRAGLLELERVISDFEGSSSTDMARIETFSGAIERYQALGGYEFDASLKKGFEKLGLPISLADRSFGELSGGQQVKVGLAGVLLSKFDVLLLDEPTNNLDLEGLALLEEHVAVSPASMLIVSHDRRFLDRTVTAIAEIDPDTRGLVIYGMGYAQYRESRAKALAVGSRQYNDYLDEVNRLQAAVTRASKEVSRGAGRSSDNDKLGANYRTARGVSSAAGDKRRAVKALKRLTVVAQPSKSWELRLQLTAVSRSGEQVLRLDECTVSYPGFRFGPVSLEVNSGQRVAIVGPNGSGKTTLAALMTGRLSPETGRIRLGEGVHIGRIDQDQSMTFECGNALEAFMYEVGTTDESEARTLLAKFDLSADDVLRPTQSLSPGERARLMLAALMAKGPNLLVLDEPTNHLDLEAQEQLEAALIGYSGTVIVVSHDREFLERIGVTTVFEVEDGKVTQGATPFCSTPHQNP